MYWFDVSIHARPRKMELGPIVAVRGHQLQTLSFSAAALEQPLNCSFEEAEVRLTKLPRMFFEPDGSFVWVSDQDPNWQMDGMLYDREDSIVSIEIKGSCASEAFDQFLTAVGWPGIDLVFHLKNELVHVDEGEFRKIAAIAP